MAVPGDRQVIGRLSATAWSTRALVAEIAGQLDVLDARSGDHVLNGADLPSAWSAGRRGSATPDGPFRS